MTQAELSRDVIPDEAEKPVPLVLEIMPGHAAEGLITVYEPGSYEDATLRLLCDRVLQKSNLSLEEQLILEDIARQLEGGKLLCRGQEIDGAAIAFAIAEETEAGEKYFYVPVRAIRPQEGGMAG